MIVTSFYLFFCGATKKAMATFCFSLTTRKVITMNRGLLLWFDYNNEKEDDNLCHLLQWLCCTKWHMRLLWFCYEKCDDNNVVTFLYGGGVVEKAMVGGNFFFLIFLVLLV